MRTYYELDENEEYQAAQDLLVRRCRGWAGERGLPADPVVLAAALDFRHLSADGRLSFWTSEHVRRLLLEWIPRHIAAGPEELKDAPASVATLLRFLAETGLSDPRAGTVAEAVAAAEAAADEFTVAVADPKRHSIGKFWVRTAIDHGVDPRDPEALAMFLADAEAGRVRYDEELLTRLIDAELAWDGPAERRAMPQLPVSLPSSAELAAAAAASPVVRQLQALAAWVGPDGRPLTDAGNLRLADARDLAAALGDGEERLRLRSSAEMPRLTVILAWAERARLLRRRHGRLVQVAKARPLLADPEALWRRAFDAFFELADAICRPIWVGDGSSLLRELYSETVPDVLNSIYSMPHPVPLPRLEESAWLACHEVYGVGDGDPRRQDVWRRRLAHDLSAVIAALIRLGAVAVTRGMADPEYRADLTADDVSAVRGQARAGQPGGVGDDESDLADRAQPFPPEAAARLAERLSRPCDLVALTPLGTRAMRARLLAEGREAPLVGELAGAAPAELLGVVAGHYTRSTGAAEVAGWLDAHDGDVGSLLAAVRACPFRIRAGAMLDVLVQSLPDGAALLRGLRGDPALAPAVLLALLKQGVIDMNDLTEREQALAMTENLLRLMEMSRPEEMRERLVEMPPGNMRALLEVARSCGHPDTRSARELRELVIDPLIGRDRVPRPARGSARGVHGHRGHGRKRRH